MSVRIRSAVSVPTLKDEQGSVLRPILFTMYIAQLEKIISTSESLKYHFYADDTQIYWHITLDDNFWPSGEVPEIQL